MLNQFLKVLTNFCVHNVSLAMYRLSHFLFTRSWWL